MQAQTKLATFQAQENQLCLGFLGSQRLISVLGRFCNPFEAQNIAEILNHYIEINRLGDSDLQFSSDLNSVRLVDLKRSQYFIWYTLTKEDALDVVIKLKVFSNYLGQIGENPTTTPVRVSR